MTVFRTTQGSFSVSITHKDLEPTDSLKQVSPHQLLSNSGVTARTNRVRILSQSSIVKLPNLHPKMTAA